MTRSLVPEATLVVENVRFLAPIEVVPHLLTLPWRQPLESWDKRSVKLLEVKSGLSRHVVRFVQTNGHRFAIKETSLESACREYGTYLKLREKEIRTLIPVGIVARDDGTRIIETHIGSQPQRRETGYLVTELMEKVVPDSFLFRRGFTKENRRRIWGAVIDLFVQMHSRGVYWGDASLANMLIHFSHEVEPHLGRRTKLRAILADAETVEIHPSITDSLRTADLEFFIESMQWTEADLQASGIVRTSMITPEDQEFLLNLYADRYAVELEEQYFELITKIDVDTVLGGFDVKGYSKQFLKHINEHKWYLSERRNSEVPLVEAASDWYSEVFRPVCKLFVQYDFSRYFPEKTAARLYIEIMEHKYYMSEQARKDVGILAAAKDYVSNYATQQPPLPTLRSILRELKTLFRRL